MDSKRLMRCSFCCKRFDKPQKLLAHMNQPDGFCSGKIRPGRMIRIPINKLDLPGQDPAQPPSPTAEQFVDDPDIQMFNHMDVDEPMELPSDIQADGNNGHRKREEYPGASHTYPGGDTFMDAFDKAEFAEERRTNLFYPFASRQEWEMASFLVRSNLSMAAMNEFLSLQMVHFWPVICSILPS